MDLGEYREGLSGRCVCSDKVCLGFSLHEEALESSEVLSVVEPVALIEATVLVAERAADAIHAELLVEERSAVLSPELLILPLSYNVCLLNLAVGELTPVTKMTVASREPVSAHLSFVLGDIALVFLFLRHLIIAALGEASLLVVAGYEGSDSRGTGERLLARHGHSRREGGGLEGLRSRVERLRRERIGRNEFFNCAWHKWLSGCCGLQ